MTIGLDLLWASLCTVLCASAGVHRDPRRWELTPAQKLERKEHRRQRKAAKRAAKKHARRK